jgi:hypothetical protein
LKTQLQNNPVWAANLAETRTRRAVLNSLREAASPGYLDRQSRTAAREPASATWSTSAPRRMAPKEVAVAINEVMISVFMGIARGAAVPRCRTKRRRARLSSNENYGRAKTLDAVNSWDYPTGYAALRVFK